MIRTNQPVLTPHPRGDDVGCFKRGDSPDAETPEAVKNGGRRQPTNAASLFYGLGWYSRWTLLSWASSTWV